MCGGTMDKPMGNFSFRIMSLMFKIRDLLIPRINILKEVDIKQGFYILDYGCGPGSYSIIASEMVGQEGKVYSLDINPLAVQTVKNKAEKRGLKNIETICSSSATGLREEGIDVILLYDTFHHFSNPNEILKELHRVLKPSGILSFSDHHLKESEIVSGVTKSGLFKLSEKGKKTYRFIKKTGIY
jgi:ubiquinone/menaquinone biosynthesis C-methylase UbiE